MGDQLRVTVANGKYTVVLPEKGGLYALRYGEKWRDCCGDGLILSLALRIEELQEELSGQKKEDIIAEYLFEEGKVAIDRCGIHHLDRTAYIFCKLLEDLEREDLRIKLYVYYSNGE